MLSFRLSNTLAADFCVAALQEALERFGVPEIFNTDQGSQFTSEDWLDVLKATGCRISMDGKGRWIDNVFIERLWRCICTPTVTAERRNNGCGPTLKLTTAAAFIKRSSIAPRTKCTSARAQHQSHWRPDYHVEPAR